MAHTVVIQSVTRISTDDSATVTGTVDGLPFTVSVRFSALTSAPNVAAAQLIIANAAVATLPTDPVSTPVGTYNGTVNL